MKPALTTSGKTRTATAFDLHLAAAGFWVTSCCRARRESLIKSSADAVPVLSNATVASNSPAAYFHFDVIFIYVFVSLGYLVVPGGKKVTCLCCMSLGFQVSVSLSGKAA